MSGSRIIARVGLDYFVTSNMTHWITTNVILLSNPNPIPNTCGVPQTQTLDMLQKNYHNYLAFTICRIKLTLIKTSQAQTTCVLCVLYNMWDSVYFVLVFVVAVLIKAHMEDWALTLHYP